jgi:hypothetical protein
MSCECSITVEETLLSTAVFFGELFFAVAFLLVVANLQNFYPPNFAELEIIIKILGILVGKHQPATNNGAQSTFLFFPKLFLKRLQI